MLDPMGTSIKDILVFLQVGLEKGLSTSTLRRQVAAISAVQEICRGESLTICVRTLRSRGVSLLCLPEVHRSVMWNLNVVLNTLCKASVEPLISYPLKELTFKTVFLVGMTSA